MSVAEAQSRIDTESVYGASLSAEAILSLGSMEGVYDPVVSIQVPSAVPSVVRHELLPGYLAAGAVVALAFVIHQLPFPPFTLIAESGVRHPISAAMIAIILGLVGRNTLALPQSLNRGCKHIVKKVIPLAIVLAGAGLNLAHVAAVGLPALAVVMLCIAVGMLGGYYVGRLVGLNPKTALLLGTGTGICGNSAIAAVAPLIEAEENDIVLSIATVNLFGLLAMLVWPMVGALLQLGDEEFGVWAGTSIHAVPQVVAAGFAFSPDAGTLATLVKLGRVTLLAPLVFILAVMYARQHEANSPAGTPFALRYARLIPWFVWCFVIIAVINTLGLMPTLEFRPAGFLALGASGSEVSLSLRTMMTGSGKVLLALAMAAIGLEVNLRLLAGVGKQAIQAGFLSTMLLGAVSLVLVVLLV